MGIILFDGAARQTLLPLTFTRPVADLRIGILTIAEKWQKYLDQETSFLTQDYLQSKFPLHTNNQNLLINGSVCPDERLLEAIDNLHEGEALIQQDFLIAAKATAGNVQNFQALHASFKAINYTSEFTRIIYPEDTFSKNDQELRKDFDLLTKGKVSAAISPTNTILGDRFFAEEGAVAECATFNTRLGPVYLGARAEVMEGANIRGSFSLGEGSQVKMGAKIYGGTTVGPHSTVGGEIKNAVIWGYSSKGHEGYLGNSVIGEWCNIGADSNNSNLKNTYSQVKLWDYSTQKFRNTNLQFCGLMMADHAKCGINTMFNTGTVVGVGSNVFGAGYPPKFIPDFSWGGIHNTEIYAINKALETARLVFERKNKTFNATEAGILKHIFELTTLYKK